MKLPKLVDFGIRLAIAIALGIATIRFAASAGLAAVGVVVLYGFVLFLLFGIPLLQKAGEKATSIYLGDESQMRIMPEYSTAEARVKAGRYADAVEEFRKVIAQHPDDIYAHIRIADLAVAHLQDVRLAEMELTTALLKAVSDDAITMAAGRLADLYQYTLHDTARAIEVLRQLQARLPATKHVLGAQQRIDTMGQAEGGPPTTPPKVGLRASRYKMPE